MFERQSALQGVPESRGGDQPVDGWLLRLGELRGWSLVQVAAFAGTLTDLEHAVGPALHGNLPRTNGKVVDAGGKHLLLKTGAEQYWIITHDGDDLACKLRPMVAPSIGSVTSLSHSRTRIFIEGVVAKDVLASAVALDLHSDVFGVGEFALTGLHHTPVLLLRSGENRYELFVMRTFARSVWQWLGDVALPHVY